MNLNELSKWVADDIDNFCETHYDDGHRNHLGSSLIGHECKRYLWYTFRWCYSHKHSGRVQRLFQRGHLEEFRFIEWLRGIGFVVWDKDEATGKQIRISDCNGHFGGSLDGIGRFPDIYITDEPVILEFKTNGTGKGFDELTAKGMRIAKPQHFAQVSTYGFKLNISHALYLNINKNDDTIHTEVVKLDMGLGQQMINKAEMIINSPIAPSRISDNPNQFKCRYCDMKGICHEQKPIEKNCRSCTNAKPIENSEWFCETYNSIIPKEFIKNGCELWSSVV